MIKQKVAIYGKSMVALFFCIIISFVVAQREDKKRDGFKKVDGIVLALDNGGYGYPRNDSVKFRYLTIDNYPMPFELFIGKSVGDFKPKFENLDELKLYDSVTVYFDESFTSNKSVNSLAHYIDRGSENVFIHGNSMKYYVIGFGLFCAIFMVVLYIMKRKGKIY